MIEIEKSPKELLAEKVAAYRRVFGDQYGKQVLTDILGILKFQGRLNSPEDMALHNAGLQIMEYCGIWYAENAVKITDKLFELSPPIIEED